MQERSLKCWPYLSSSHTSHYAYIIIGAGLSEELKLSSATIIKLYSWRVEAELSIKVLHCSVTLTVNGVLLLNKIATINFIGPNRI